MRLRPGTILSEQLLALRFKIGRTPVREALQRLANEGLVIILPRKGILVSGINPREQLLVLEARREIERLLSRASAERATDSEKAAFLKIAGCRGDSGTCIIAKRRICLYARGCTLSKRAQSPMAMPN